MLSLARVFSLLNLATKCVLDNVDKYDKNLLKSVIGPLRRDLIEKTWQIVKNHSHENCSDEDDHVDKLWATLPFLVSKSYVTFDTTDLMKMSRKCNNFYLSASRFEELVSCLGSNTPNLRYLIIKGLPELYLWLEGRGLASITALKSLQVLRIEDVSVPLSGVVAITQQCDKLEKISANKVYMDEKPSSDAFTDDFVFVSIYAYNFREQQLDLALQKTMPIEELPRCAAYSRYKWLYIEPWKVYDLKYVLQGFTQVTELRLNLSYMDDIFLLDEFPVCPEVRFAHIACGRSAHALRRFLKSNGQSLQELVLKDISGQKKVTLAEVFNLCPNLHSLEIIDVDFTATNLPIEAMRRLNKLKWKLQLNVDSLVELDFWPAIDIPGDLCFAVNFELSEDIQVSLQNVVADMQRNQANFDFIVNSLPIAQHNLEGLSRMLIQFQKLNNALLLYNSDSSTKCKRLFPL